MVKKLSISMNDELLERIDKYAEENYLNRSAVISFAVKQYLDAQSVIGSLADMALEAKSKPIKAQSDE